MIIRVNFNDNDFGSYFEEFFRQFKFVNYYENVRQLRDRDDEKSLREYRDKKIDMEELYEKVFYKPDDLTPSEKRRFSKYVKESILAYLSIRVDKDVLQYLDINTTVTLRKTYVDEWENGETIYYFIGRDKSILQ